ncbi:LamG domain-containing protein [Streptomyces sp. NPDC001822]|uniref:LamG domain-containing protein n=1 Tax=Streptomyces sp. NPDC001822 TaxID=3364614 RepID=UPI0036B3C224
MGGVVGRRRGRTGCRKARRLWSAVVMSTLLAGIPAWGTMSASAARATERTPAASGARAAAAKAVQTGERQEVVEQRTEYATTYANPDGLTFTLEQSAVPVRVRQSDGSWVTPDTTLIRRADGSVGPKAAVAALSFSGSGDGEGLVKVSKSGRSLGVGWPGVLPTPTLTGATARYADVLPGVDLQLTAEVEGYREVLIVKTAEAAASAELKKLQFPVKTERLTLRKEGLGSLSAVDENGTTVFRSPAARQWDSAGDRVTKNVPAPRPSDALLSEDADGESTPDPASGPGNGDASTVLPVHTDAESITVVPDAAMLTGEDAVFPQYIDPDVSWGESERTLLSSGPDTSYNFSGGTDGKGVGRCSIYVTGGVGYVCSETSYANRMYFEFAPTQLAGKRVLDATFRVTERWSMSCVPSTVDLVRTGNISSATRWPGPASSGWDVMVDRTVSAGRGTACSPDQPDAPIEFHDDSKQAYENLTPTVQSFAAGTFSRLTLMLKAHDENDPNSWKRFDDDAVLDVTYVGLPAPPTSAGIVEGTGISCETNPADPDVISDPTPTMTATAQTVAGGESEASLRAHFYVQKKNSDGTWGVATEPVRPSAGFVRDNQAVAVSSPITLSEGPLYRMAVFTRSYYNGDTSLIESHSTLTTKGWCYFLVDTTAPKAPSITFDGPYTLCLPDACAPGGGPGIKGNFTFAPASGDRNAAYQYKLSSSPSWSAPITGATVQAGVTPQLAGTQQLQVRAQDSVGSGRWGAKAIVEFKVAEGQEATGRWHFDDQPPGSTVTTALDSATEGVRHPATLNTAAGAGWSTFARRGDGDRSLFLNDTSDTAHQAGYAATQAPAVNTQSSFTVSAWAYLTDDSAYRGVLSQMGSDSSGFSLYYSPSVKRWVFLWTWNEGGVQKQLGVNAESAGVPLKAWTHLAGVYDKNARTISLFVNGRRQGTPVALPAASLAQTTDGVMQFGRRSSKFNEFKEYWRGRVDEVAVWQRPLTDEGIATESRLLDSSNNPAVELTAAWNPAGASGATLPDTTTGYGRTLTLSGGATLDGEAIVLDGLNGAATTPGPLVDDTGSFTVTSEVALNKTALMAKPDGYSGQILGQRSADGSSWGLWYHRDGSTTEVDDDGNQVLVPQGYWEFGRLNTDGSFTAVQSDTAAETGSPVQLTGVYDAITGEIHLYLKSTESGAGATHAFTAVAGTGDFAVGEGYVAGAWDHYAPAALTDIRLWAGAVANEAQLAAVVGE